MTKYRIVKKYAYRYCVQERVYFFFWRNYMDYTTRLERAVATISFLQNKDREKASKPVIIAEYN